MPLRSSKLTSLLLLVTSAACGFSEAESAADSSLAGAGGSDSLPVGEAGKGTGGSVEGGNAGSMSGQPGGGPPAAGAAGSGTAGSGTGGPGGTGGTGGSPGQGGAPTDFLCAEDSDSNQTVECSDNAQACVSVCGQPQQLRPKMPCQFSLAGRPSGVQPWCALQAQVGPSMAFAFRPDFSGWVRLEAISAGNDLVLSATDGDCEGQATVCHNQLGPGGRETLRLKVKPGDSLTVLVTGATPQAAEAVFSLSMVIETPLCGDGLVEGDEVCDDGNQTNGDLCAGDCLSVTGCLDAEALPDLTEDDGLPVPTIREGKLAVLASSPQALASCVTVGATVSRTIYALRAENTGRLQVQLEPKAGHDVALSVRSSCGTGAELACSDGQGAEAGSLGQERLSLPATVGETFYLVLEGYGAEGADYVLQAQTLPVICGDGLLVDSVEQCDPGAADLACRSDCTRSFDGAPASGAPGAGDAPAAVVMTQDEIRAQVLPAGDVDDYVLTTTGPVRVAVTDAGAAEDCKLGHLDSQLTVLDAQGHVVAFNDDAGPGAQAALGYCSEVQLPQAGTYTVRVRSSEASAPAQVFSYRLRVVPAGG